MFAVDVRKVWEAGQSGGKGGGKRLRRGTRRRKVVKDLERGWGKAGTVGPSGGDE